MARIGTIQLAHVPILPGIGRAMDGEEFPEPIGAILHGMAGEMGRDVTLLKQMAERLEAWRPDVLVFFDCDHVNTFFLNHVPSIAVGVDDTTSGPSDHPLGHPDYPVIPVDRRLGEEIHRGLIARGFDPSRAERFSLDHSTTVPLHFVNPEMSVPIVPIWINGLGGVPIRSERAFALGGAVGEIVDEIYPEKRVVFLSSGALSVDIGTPRVFPGTVFGVPNMVWVRRASDLIAAGEIDQLVTEATPETLRVSGNAAAEVLTIIAAAAACGATGARPEFFELREGPGHTFAVWNGSGVS